MKIRIKLLVLFIIVGVGAAVAMNMGLFESEDPPKDIKDRIKALETDDFEIASIKDTGNLYKVQLMLSDVVSDNVAESWAKWLCEEVHTILWEESLDRDISVKTYVDVGDTTKYYGETFYDASEHWYEYTKANQT